MADKLGISNSSVGRIWRALGLKPHRSETFQLSTDPLFVEKVRDVVGLYMNPPSITRSCYAWTRNRRSRREPHPADVPLRPGQAARGTPRVPTQRDDRQRSSRPWTRPLATSSASAGHRAVEFRKFLNEIRRNVPTQLDVHIIVDNYATHSAPTIKRWSGQQPEVPLPLHPLRHLLTGSTKWKVGLSILATKQIKRGSHKSVEQLRQSRVPRRMERKPHTVQMD